MLRETNDLRFSRWVVGLILSISPGLWTDLNVILCIKEITEECINVKIPTISWSEACKSSREGVNAHGFEIDMYGHHGQLSTYIWPYIKDY